MKQEQWLGAPSATRSVVVGGGTMGADVAVVLLRARSKTIIVEPAQALHAGLCKKVAENLQAIDRGDHISLLDVVVSIDDIAWQEVGLVIECVPESLQIKRDLFKALAEKAPAHALLTSNSSSFPISQIAQGLPTQERMMGLHFFMPAHIVPLVEVVLGSATDRVAADALSTFMKRCGSVPILVRKDVPGFIGNRLQHALGREAFSLIQEGIATPEDIDAAVRFGFGFRYLAAGPVMQKEHAGLDVHAAAAATIYPSLSNAAVPPAVLADKPKAGHLGMKTGQGFYVWDEQRIAIEKQRYTRALQASLRILAEDLPPIEP
ncbi:3-hydroxyacyl-CoA dehydrogenase family protein [Pollutimonas harenae]|uniref:3-hydroxyacyl-CoA dehydrogenase n=1 Tax=Pollutimonas harenae TaxID=657015 RepID=A0A853H2Q0_9BURK|nr:3-hydroxyacyl-CoA dehydrogenase NAD-binding domain-containing protein [Pollutimonas harenae]NYT86542.1 3-hydroxyacyl-CoA dehydrogenase [Pollutimonas harenae]TEA69716.1 3-hydroxyacyl-CoA dehydrogenase [Pollutimonas harenae]